MSWHEARAFCVKLSQQTGREARLPTEAEWEYACRAGTTTPFAFGNTVTTDQVNYDGNYPYGDAPKGKYREVTVNVDSFQPNAWGIYQMHGNVWEWCLDEWHDSYADKPENLKKQGNLAWGDLNAGDNDDRYRLLRGGSWDSGAWDCRAAFRGGENARVQDDCFGFRILIASSS
ncbi:formylglycine-generating enzyme family protein [Pseudanabaena sp. UWO310]|uniref:formylglycine-generating enzyme family protein n=1 Tax=Pseudanabaena sp. UWO310 TaxID=2480795 RepID=UPI001CC1C8E6|nr:formylglycine-generating enzyme family protein [Pseudanabaena sp. UWO310]